MHTHTHFKINQLRLHNQQKLLEAVVALFTAIFVTALLPSLLLEYLYADQVLTEAPPVLKYLPLISFLAGALYVIYTTVTNMARSRKIAELERELALNNHDGMMDSATDEQELKELEALVDEALASQSKKSTRSSKPARKTAAKKKSKK